MRVTAHQLGNKTGAAHHPLLRTSITAPVSFSSLLPYSPVALFYKTGLQIFLKYARAPCFPFLFSYFSSLSKTLSTKCSQRFCLPPFLPPLLCVRTLTLRRLEAATFTEREKPVPSNGREIQLAHGQTWPSSSCRETTSRWCQLQVSPDSACIVLVFIATPSHHNGTGR